MTTGSCDTIKKCTAHSSIQSMLMNKQLALPVILYVFTLQTVQLEAMRVQLIPIHPCALILVWSATMSVTVKNVMMKRGVLKSLKNQLQSHPEDLVSIFFILQYLWA